MSTDSPIIGRVAAILDDRQLVLSVGAQQGVTRGQHFAVFEDGPEVKDPVTGESLGTLDIIKAELQVAHAQERLAIAVLPAAPASAPQVLSAVLSQIPGGGGQVLTVNRAQVTGRPHPHPIAVGDRVRSV